MNCSFVAMVLFLLKLRLMALLIHASNTLRCTSIKITDLSGSLLENSVITLSSLLCSTFSNSLQIERLASFHMGSKLLSYSREDGRTRKILFNVCRKSCTPVDLEFLLHCLLENSSLVLGLG